MSTEITPELCNLELLCLFLAEHAKCGMEMACCASHSIEMGLHHQAKFKGLALVLCWFRLILSRDFWVFIPISTMNCPNILICLLWASLHFLLPSVHTFAKFQSCLTFSIRHVQFWKKAEKSAQQIKDLFWGFCFQSSSLNWQNSYHIPIISPHVVMPDRFNHPDHCVSGESVQILHQSPKKACKSKALLLVFQLHSKHA